MTWVAGADACTSGWYVVALNVRTGATAHHHTRFFAEILGLGENPRILAVNMPIGLLSKAEPGGRACDREARRLLGRARGTSVFSPPVASALKARDYSAADAANRASSLARVGLSRQSWALAPRLAEVDRNVTAEVQQRVKEVHPELAFLELGDGRPARYPKRTTLGLDERIRLLRRAGFGDPLAARHVASGVAVDDVLDAMAAAWTARRIFEGVAMRVPTQPAYDATGRTMEIWR